jgi:hypothetical protein
VLFVVDDAMGEEILEEPGWCGISIWLSQKMLNRHRASPSEESDAISPAVNYILNQDIINL